LPLVVRAARPGDRFAPRGLGGRKKLQDYFVDAKIPRWHRPRVALLTDAADRILWVIGHRRAAVGGVSERTERVLRVRAAPARRA
ncbi:MAG TPA: tRNA lysidine(34) synthetase TilS, partial [bacterium]|nr:tRNA lysidine(34) synthetase TilS [bacterium]